MKRILSLGVIYLCCYPVWANTAHIEIDTSSYTRSQYVAIAAGIAMPHIGGDNYIGSGTGWPADHYSQHSSSNEPSAILSSGYVWVRENTWLPAFSIGLTSQYVYPMTLKGSVDQYSLPAFRNYNYKYDIQLLDLMGTVKLNIVRWHDFMPYLTLSGGFVNYRISNYKENAVAGVTPRISPGFQSDNNYNLAYTAGLGLAYVLQENLALSLEYNYSDFGTISTGKGASTQTLTGTNYSNELLQNTLTMNTLLAGLTIYIK